MFFWICWGLILVLMPVYDVENLSRTGDCMGLQIDAHGFGLVRSGRLYLESQGRWWLHAGGVRLTVQNFACCPAGNVTRHTMTFNCMNVGGATWTSLNQVLFFF